MRTRAGTAEMTTLGGGATSTGPAGRDGSAVAVTFLPAFEVPGGDAVSEFLLMPAPVPTVFVGGKTTTSLYPRAVQMLSKNEGGTTAAAEEVPHERALHICFARFCGETPDTALYP